MAFPPRDVLFAPFQLSEQFAPGVYDNSDLPLTDLERQILELRSKDRNEEVVGETGTLIKSLDVGSVARLHTYILHLSSSCSWKRTGRPALADFPRMYQQLLPHERF